MAKTVTKYPAPDLFGKPVVNFTVEEHNAMVWNKGLDVTRESALICPCKTTENSHLSTCQNCLGTGWILINSTEDRVVVSSININTEYKDWSEEKIGTVNLTAAKRLPFSYMDRITILDESVIDSELLYPKPFSGNYFSYSIYDIDEVVDMFQFASATSKLVKLEQDVDFTFERNKILFVVVAAATVTILKALTTHEENNKSLVNGVTLYQYSATSTATPDDDNVVKPDDITLPAAGRWLKLTGFVVSMRYKHKLQYHVIDVPHVFRNSYRKDSMGRDELQQLPVNAIARLSHYVIDSLNFDGDNIFDNSYNT